MWKIGDEARRGGIQGGRLIQHALACTGRASTSAAATLPTTTTATLSKPAAAESTSKPTSAEPAAEPTTAVVVAESATAEPAAVFSAQYRRYGISNCRHRSPRPWRAHPNVCLPRPLVLPPTNALTRLAICRSRAAPVPAACT